MIKTIKKYRVRENTKIETFKLDFKNWVSLVYFIRAISSQYYWRIIALKAGFQFSLILLWSSSPTEISDSLMDKPFYGSIAWLVLTRVIKI